MRVEAIDTLTHALAGAVVANSGLNRKLGGWGTAAGVVAALFPDADYFIRFISMEFYLRHHRGITTSADQQGLKYTKLACLPQPLSPLRWINLSQTEDIREASFPFLYVVEFDEAGRLIRQGFGLQ